MHGIVWNHSGPWAKPFEKAHRPLKILSSASQYWNAKEWKVRKKVKHSLKMSYTARNCNQSLQIFRNHVLMLETLCWRNSKISRRGLSVVFFMHFTSFSPHPTALRVSLLKKTRSQPKKFEISSI